MTSTAETVSTALRIADDTLGKCVDTTSDPELRDLHRRIRALRDGRRVKTRSPQRLLAHLQIAQVAAEHVESTGDRIDDMTLVMATSIAAEWLAIAGSWGCDPPGVIFELALETAMSARSTRGRTP